ncbi:MAG: NTF2-like N-terminal transpeptidase domain-containing protein [Planctomycetota bacterium]
MIHQKTWVFAMHNPNAGEDVALTFTRALAEGRFGEAYEMLSSAYKSEVQPEQLRDHFSSMIEHYGSEVVDIRLLQTDLDSEEYEDSKFIGWYYVSISGPFLEDRLKPGQWSEAVAVTIIQENNKAVITRIDWGRP